MLQKTYSNGCKKIISAKYYTKLRFHLWWNAIKKRGFGKSEPAAVFPVKQT